jgi:Zn-dependent protease
MGLDRFRLLGGMILLTGIGVGIWQLAIGLPNIPTYIQPEILQPPVVESIRRALTSLGIILLITGVILMFSGILTFIRYRRENPQPYAEDA